MNILFVAKEFPHSKVIGGPIIVYNRVKLLSENHTVSLVAFDPEQVSEQEAETTRRYCHEMRLVPAVKPPEGAISKAIDFFAGPVPPYFMLNYSTEMYAAIREMTRNNRYDVVISEYSMASQYLYKNPDLDGVKKVMSVHECYYLARKKVWEMERWNRKGLTALAHLKGLWHFEFGMYASADKVLTLTEEGRDELLEERPRLDIEVVPHGVDTDSFQPQPKPSGTPPTVTFLGNYLHDPNRDAIVWFIQESWPAVKKAVPGVKLLVVGRGPTEDMLALAKDDPSIDITGQVEDVRPHLHASDIFICPVRFGGGFRGKVLEAMSCGIPVVSTSLGAEGLPVEDGKNLEIADSAIAISDRIIALFKDDARRRKIADESRKLMVERFSWQYGVGLLEKVLLEVVHGGKR